MDMYERYLIELTFRTPEEGWVHHETITEGDSMDEAILEALSRVPEGAQELRIEVEVL